MEVLVKKTDKGYLVEEPNGIKRELCNLYFGQMVYSSYGRFFYRDDIPDNYFEKAELLRANGWDTGYHYEDWYKMEKGWTEHGGINTDSAIKALKKTGL